MLMPGFEPVTLVAHFDQKQRLRPLGHPGYKAIVQIIILI